MADLLKEGGILDGNERETDSFDSLALRLDGSAMRRGVSYAFGLELVDSLGFQPNSKSAVDVYFDSRGAPVVDVKTEDGLTFADSATISWSADAVVTACADEEREFTIGTSARAGCN